MSSIGSNPMPHAGCGAPPGATPVMPNPGTMPAFGGGFAFPSAAAPMPMEPERFVASSAGGLILDKDGAPAGRIAAGSFVDTKDGKVYGPDNKPIVLPEGSSVDFFDLPSVKQLMDDAKAMAAFAATANGGGGNAKGAAPGTTAGDSTTAPTKTAVDGQWGPGGVTDLKGGGAKAADDCDSSHGPTATKGSSGTGHSHATTTAGGGTTKATASTPTSQSALAAQLQAMATQLQTLVGGVSGGGASAAASGAATAATGASHLGTLPGLHASLNDLVATLRQLTDALAGATKGGGGIWQLPPPPPKAPPVPAKATTATPTSTSTTATTKTTPATTSTTTSTSTSASDTTAGGTTTTSSGSSST